MTQLADELERHLPYLRRYARALTGSQTNGDDLAFRALQRIGANRSQVAADRTVRLSLFRAFHHIWSDDRAAIKDPTDGSREALLLATLEGFSREDIGFILEAPPNDVAALLRQAMQDIQKGGTGDILIIEDDAIIATDLRTILEKNGHRVLNVARTHQDAVTLARQNPPELILADIQLADGSSGVDAVQDILADFGQLPIIFVTAFPELLLTGRRPEPAFLIAKPFKNEQITSAVSQAIYFASTDALVAADGR